MYIFRLLIYCLFCPLECKAYEVKEIVVFTTIFPMRSMVPGSSQILNKNLLAELWLVWLSGVNDGLQIKRLLV